MDWITDIQFADPWFFLLLLGIPLYLYLRKRIERNRFVRLRMSTLEGVSKKPAGRVRFMFLLPVFRLLTYICIVIARASIGCIKAKIVHIEATIGGKGGVANLKTHFACGNGRVQFQRGKLCSIGG